jgi:hypothetical protein
MMARRPCIDIEAHTLGTTGPGIELTLLGQAPAPFSPRTGYLSRLAVDRLEKDRVFNDFERFPTVARTDSAATTLCKYTRIERITPVKVWYGKFDNCNDEPSNRKPLERRVRIIFRTAFLARARTHGCTADERHRDGCARTSGSF